MNARNTFYKISGLLLALCFALPVIAQTYNDGAMQLQVNISRSYVESVDDPLTGELNDNEFRWRWWVADNADLDGLGFLGGSVIAVNSGSSGWHDHPDFVAFNHTYGPGGPNPITVPQFIQLRGESWEDDCFDCFRSTGTITFACDQCSSTIYDGGCGCSTNVFCGCSSEDQHCGPTTISSSINYRVIPPCMSLVQPPTVGNAWLGDFISSVCGNDDLGAQLLVRWTPPIPSPVISTASVLCQPGLVTLSTGGAVFGGDYNWYNHGTNLIVGQGSQITPFVGTTTTYRVHTVNNGCESLSYRLFTVTVGSPAIASVSAVNPSCFGSTNGSITISASGGNGALQYSIDAGTTWQPSGVFNNLAAGFYNVWVRDANNCTVIYPGNSVILTQPQPISIFVNKVDASCNGASSGRIDVFAGGGSGNLQFSVNGGTTYQPSSVFANLPAGNYTVMVRDANGCSYSFLGNPVTISQPTPVTATATVQNASCQGNGNGSISVTASGGTSPYNYSLNNGPFFPNSTFPGLASGTYNILVADVNGCQGTVSATISNTYSLSLAVQNQTDVSCSGGADGSVTVAVTGGVSPFQYSIDGGNTWQNSATFIGLSGGAYTVQVTDNNGCLATTPVTIIEKPTLNVAVVSVVNVGCYGDSTGVVNVIATGGDSTYTYLWSNGQTQQNLTGVPGGNYAVTVTDGAGCSASTAATVASNPALIIQLEKSNNVLCHGGQSGGLDITVNGGLPGYGFAWSNSATTEDIYGIGAGSYAVTVTDAAQCTATAFYNVNQPGVQVTATFTKTDVSCPGGADGTATAAGTGGTPPYNYQWLNAQTGATATALTAGAYVVEVTDSNNCSYFGSVTVGEPAAFAFAETIHPATCNASADGGVDIVVTGGTPGYNYFWSNGVSTQNITGVTAGVYTVTVTDTKACTATAGFEVTEPSAILTAVAGSNPDCSGNSTGFAVVSVSGGKAPYTYTWGTNPLQNGVMGVSLKGGQVYFVSVTDANNCLVVDSVALTDPSPVVVTTVPTNVKCFDGNSGQVIIQATGGTGAGYEYFLNGIYQQTPTFTGLTAGNYTAVAQDENNCIGSVNFTITQPDAFFVDAGPDVIALIGQTVQLNGQATSPNGILGYEWTPGDFLSCTLCQTTQSTPDSTMQYYLIAMDGDSCLIRDSVTVFIELATNYFIPTAFTPNGDQLNDFFEVDILGAETIEASIFNRWGERMYYNDNLPNGLGAGNGWNGTLNGKPVPADTYVYQLKVNFFNGSEKVVSGTVVVMR